LTARPLFCPFLGPLSADNSIIYARMSTPTLPSVACKFIFIGVLSDFAHTRLNATLAVNFGAYFKNIGLEVT